MDSTTHATGPARARRPIGRPVRRLAALAAAMTVVSALATGLLWVRMSRTGEASFSFLTWNLFLAWVPFVLAVAMGLLHARGGSRWALLGLGVGWLLFLPNAPYILTDLIHLGAIPGAPLWFDATLIGAFAVAGLALGIASLLVVHHVVQERLGVAAGWAVAVSSLVLSALGVYLGRFPRFNSWDVLTNLDGLVGVVLKRLGDPLGNPFLIQFGVAMSAALIGSYAAAWWVGGRRLDLRPVTA
ncbi:DUF1361 domain-containing protein [Janibacter alkaliphilus]|uniref:Putative membrane protein n=1 Tax=Janibacter alkaliphilus TaxID=1069963 RepID=A0A852X4K0_9MICO|nr:DUF1361 domain-containing protein [Janibacter alkaliphilus]NYG36280.1 putative membrane protein [Janibacter alkaliphilus]